MTGTRDDGSPYRPTDRDVDELIRRAENHAGGVEFLLHGAQDAVAATFGVHAFVVDAARQRLKHEPSSRTEPPRNA